MGRRRHDVLRRRPSPPGGPDRLRLAPRSSGRRSHPVLRRTLDHAGLAGARQPRLRRLPSREPGRDWRLLRARRAARRRNRRAGAERDRRAARHRRHHAGPLPAESRHWQLPRGRPRSGGRLGVRLPPERPVRDPSARQRADRCFPDRRAPRPAPPRRHDAGRRHRGRRAAGPANRDGFHSPGGTPAAGLEQSGQRLERGGSAHGRRAGGAERSPDGDLRRSAAGAPRAARRGQCGRRDSPRRRAVAATPGRRRIPPSPSA